MKAVPCALCGENEFDIPRIQRIPIYPSGWYPSVVCVCRGCGHVFLSPRPTESDLEEYYSNQVRETFNEARGTRTGQTKTDADFIERVVGSGIGNWILDVGCYTGSLVGELQQRGWDAEGLEPNKRSATIARKRTQGPIYCSSLERFQPSKRYDTVFLGGVLEHIARPVEAMLSLNQLLSNNGFLVVRVPDVEKLFLDTVADVFHFEHVNMYSERSLNWLGEMTGFEFRKRDNEQAHSRALVCAFQKVSEMEKPSPFQGGNQHDQLVRLIEEYDRHIEKQRNQVNERLAKALGTPNIRTAIYGAGSHTGFLYRETDLKPTDVDIIVDSNPVKQGEEFIGKIIQSPDALYDDELDLVIISSRAFQSEIYESIEDLEEQDVEITRLYDLEESQHPTG